jgi:hypothetical protein
MRYDSSIRHQQLSHRNEIQGQRIERKRFWRAICGGQGHEQIDALAEQDDATTAQVLLVGDFHQGKSLPEEGMARIRDGYSFFRCNGCFNSSSLLMGL